MALANYSDLVTSVQNWLHRSDLASVVPDFITLAEARINGDLDARFQDETSTIQTVSGTETIPLPDDLIGIRHVSAETSPIKTLKYVTPDQFEKLYPYGESGAPTVYTIIGSNMYLAPIPDAIYDIDLIYKARVPALNDSNTTNYVITTYPNVYLYAVLCESAPYIKDDNRVQVWEMKYKEAIDAVNAQDWYSGSTMVVRQDIRSMIPFEGFAPDLPPETPGIFTECANIIPSLGVFVGAPSPIDCGLGALDSAAKGFVVTRNLDDDALVFAGDSAKLYRQGSGVWNDVSKVGGYTLGPDDRWRFAQFGNVTLAVCGSSVIQYLDNLGSAFANAGTAPKAQAIEVINNQVFAFNIDGMGFGSDVTRWGCSAIGDYADWTPSVATQCVSGQLLDTPGPITAGRQLGDVIIAYKERSMYVGQYVGAPVVWDFRRIPGEIGAACQEAVVNTGTAHFFIGPDDFYIYDGSRPQPLNSPCRNWFFNNADQRFMYKTCGTYDRINSRVYWWFASRYSGGNLDKCIVYNIKTNKWGRMDSDIEFVAEYISSGISYDELGSLYVTYDDLPTNISYNSPFWSSGSSVVAVFKTDHTCYQLSGINASSSYTTGHYGDNMRFSTITRIRPRFIQTPTTSALKYFHSNSDASTFTQNINSTYTNNWYDLLWSARWHKMEFNNTGAIAVSGFDLLMSPDGIE